MKPLIPLIFIFLQTGLFAQNRTISGSVSDAETGEKIINAVIYQVGSSNSTQSNNFGHYSLQVVNTDSLIVNVSYIGYKTIQKSVFKNTHTIINFELFTDNQIEEVVVSGNNPIEKRIESGVLEIPVSQLNKIPAIGSETDIMKAFQLMPGIQSGNEGSSGLYVRGGSPDENLILLDDVPLYYVNHLGGFVSIFNSDAIKNVNLIKGGFPARYSGRLSSVMNVRMKEGNMKEYKGNASIGIISSKISFEGPIIKDKSSFLFSARGFLWDLLLRPVSRLASNATVGYNFYDINAKLNYKMNDNNRLYYSFYNGNDDVVVRFNGDSFNDVKASSILRWGNTLFAGRWNHMFNSKLFSNTTLSYTKYHYNSTLEYQDKTENQDYAYTFGTGINDIILKTDFEYSISSNYKIRFGTNSIYHQFKPGFSNYNYTTTETNIDTSYGFSNIFAFENRGYIENEIKLGNKISANIGFHASYYDVENTGFFSPEPRVLLNLNITETSSVKLSYTQMQQNVHLLTSNTVSLPMDVWVPSTSELPPSQSTQYAIGFYKTILKDRVELSIETYYKTSDNLIAYKEGATYRSVSKNWIDKLETEGTGTSYGAELFLQKKQGKLTGWLGYTYAETNRRFQNINFGNPYPFKYDRRHDFSIVAMYQITENIDISANWVFGSGYAYTLPIGKYEAVNGGTSNIDYNNPENIWYDEIILTYADRNAYRMRAYHRLDLNINFKKEKRRGIRTWTLGVYNAYNRQNPYYYYTKIKNSEVKLYQQSLFPIIPSFSYSFSF